MTFTLSGLSLCLSILLQVWMTACLVGCSCCQTRFSQSPQTTPTSSPSHPQTWDAFLWQERMAVSMRLLTKLRQGGWANAAGKSTTPKVPCLSSSLLFSSSPFQKMVGFWLVSFSNTKHIYAVFRHFILSHRSHCADCYWQHQKYTIYTLWKRCSAGTVSSTCFCMLVLNSWGMYIFDGSNAKLISNWGC